MQWFDEICRALPEIRSEDYRNESDFYGASDEIARSLGLPRTPVSWATWAHGWRFFEARFVEHYIWNHAPEREVLLVFRDDEKELLQRNGYASTFAVGAPFLYASAVPMRRLEKSLLIMPMHSLDYVSSKADGEEYFREVDPHLSKFEHVAACVHPSCLRKGDWIDALGRRGIPYFTGIEIRDRNGLSRLKSLLSAFTHVSSNWLGSHLPYAAHCGCSISICGPRPRMSIRDRFDDPFYKAYPHVLESFYELVEEGYFERRYAQLFREPDTVSDDRAWAAEELGERHRRTPQEIARLFNWSADFLGEADSLDPARWAPELGWKSSLEARAFEHYSQALGLRAELDQASEKIASLEAWIARLQETVQNHAARHQKREAAMQRKNQKIADLQSRLHAGTKLPQTANRNIS